MSGEVEPVNVVVCMLVRPLMDQVFPGCFHTFDTWVGAPSRYRGCLGGWIHV